MGEEGGGGAGSQSPEARPSVMERLLELAEQVGPEADAVVAVLRATRLVHCVHCNGSGHVVRECTTKKSLDKLFRETGLGRAWGRAKRKLVVNNIRAKVLTRAIRAQLVAGAVTELEAAQRQEFEAQRPAAGGAGGAAMEEEEGAGGR